MKILVTFDLEFDLKFEISGGKNLVKFGGRTFLPARKAREISGRISGPISEQISEQISEKTSFQIWRLFFGNFIQRKGGAKRFPSRPISKQPAPLLRLHQSQHRPLEPRQHLAHQTRTFEAQRAATKVSSCGWRELNGRGLKVQMVCSNFLRSAFAGNCCKLQETAGNDVYR